jgi:hypothetical protein
MVAYDTSDGLVVVDQDGKSPAQERRRDPMQKSASVVSGRGYMTIKKY